MRALDDAERCLSLDRRCMEGYHRMAACLTDMMRYDEAISAIREALKLDAGLEILYISDHTFLRMNMVLIFINMLRKRKVEDEFMQSRIDGGAEPITWV
jgi:tetratricopeptide (TPR) repeat protein